MPPREKNEAVASGELMKTLPMMSAWNMKELIQRNSAEKLCERLIRTHNRVNPVTSISPRRIEQHDVDKEGLTADQHEKSSLLTWVRRSSRGRFADTHGSRHNMAPERSEAHHRFSLSTLFVRSSLIPHVASVTAKPPTGHQFSRRFLPTCWSSLLYLVSLYRHFAVLFALCLDQHCHP
jgi:hypothetical protein